MISDAFSDAASPLPAAADWRLGKTAIRVVTVWLDHDPGLAHTMLPLLSDVERARAERFRFDQDRHRFIIARGSLRELLGAELAIDPASVALSAGPAASPISQALAGSRDCISMSRIPAIWRSSAYRAAARSVWT